MGKINNAFWITLILIVLCFGCLYVVKLAAISFEAHKWFESCFYVSLIIMFIRTILNIKLD